MGKAESEILRLVEALHREKDIDKEIVLRGLEAALLSAARKHFGTEKDISVHIDRETGAVTARDEHGEIHPAELGRIAAQTAKQVIIQKVRDAERDALTQEFGGKVMSVVSGTVQRFEGSNIVVNLPRTEGFLPRSEQIPGEIYHTGERIRALVLEVRPVGSKVRVVLSRSREQLVERLFELEVPEVGEKIVEIKAIAREPGYRTKVAVSSTDPRVDCVGACVGVQGNRIRNIVDELNGEKIDIIRWGEQADTLIAQSLKPAETAGIKLDPATRRAQVTVAPDQLSLAIGKRGQNVRLAAKLTGWEIDIRTEGGQVPREAAAQPPAPEMAALTEVSAEAPAAAQSTPDKAAEVAPQQPEPDKADSPEVAAEGPAAAQTAPDKAAEVAPQQPEPDKADSPEVTAEGPAAAQTAPDKAAQVAAQQPEPEVAASAEVTAEAPAAAQSTPDKPAEAAPAAAPPEDGQEQPASAKGTEASA